MKKNTSLLSLIKIAKSDIELTPQSLPLTISEYTFVKELTKPGVTKPHAIGIYVSTNNEYSIVKMWTGIAETPAKRSLQHEFMMFTLLRKLEKRAHQELLDAKNPVRIPKLLMTKTTPTSCILMMEYIQANTLRNFSKKTKMKVYGQVLEYLSILSSKLTTKEIRILPIRGKLELFMLYPLLLCASIIRQKSQIISLVNGIPYVLSAILLLGNKKSLQLVHRDIHGENILLKKNTPYLLDLQRLVLSNPIFEYGPSLGAEWTNKEFKEAILASIKNQAVSLPKKIITKGLLILFATHALTANNLPASYITKYKKVLTFSLTKFSIFKGFI